MPGRLQSMGSHRLGHDWSDAAAAAVKVSHYYYYYYYFVFIFFLSFVLFNSRQKIKDFWLKLTESKKESEVAQLCPTLWDPKDCSLPGASVHGIFQARVLEWVAISFSLPQSDPVQLKTTLVFSLRPKTLRSFSKSISYFPCFSHSKILLIVPWEYWSFIISQIQPQFKVPLSLVLITARAS